MTYLTPPDRLGGGVEFDYHLFYDAQSTKRYLGTNYNSGNVVVVDYAVGQHFGLWTAGLAGSFSQPGIRGAHWISPPGVIALARTIIDLSIYLDNDVVSDPDPFRPSIEYVDHSQSVPELIGFFPGLQKADLPDGEAWALERVRLTTHNGTHLDAPYHFASTMNAGERAITIDEVPLDWCFQPGVKLDFRHFEDGYVATARDVEAELARIRHELVPLEIVVVNTRAGAQYGHSDYVNAGCGMGYEATMYLLERGIRLTGTDGWSWDAPFAHTRKKYIETHDARLIWEGHKAGRNIGYSHIEKLHNLEALPADGFDIVCFPMKIRAASAGWTRAVAIVGS